MLYDANTDHIRAIPSSFRKYIGLATKRCVPAQGARERPPLTPSRCSPSPAGADPLAFRDAELLRKQVLDWKLVEEGPVLQLRCVMTAHALCFFGHPLTVCAGGPG